MITIVLPISRTEHLDKVFKCLDSLICENNTELLIIVDGKDILPVVREKAYSLKYSSIRVNLFESDGAKDSINERRYRISDIHNFAVRFIRPDCDYVFLCEDDTTFPADSLEKLFCDIKKSDYIGYVTGVQLGRHGSPYVGAWDCDNIDYPTQITSVTKNFRENNEHMEMIDAGGFYCCLTKASLYKNHIFEPFDQKGHNGLSCDVNYGLSLRNATHSNWLCFIDWSIECDHLVGKNGIINIRNTKPIQVQFNKVGMDWRAKKL
jgi:hypothetical protein